MSNQLYRLVSTDLRISGGNSVFGVGEGGGAAKLQEFPTTLHRFARLTIAYCFTKTTLGQHIEDFIKNFLTARVRLRDRL